MIRQEPYAVEPWTVTERELPTDLLASSESIFALSNGHIGLRGNLDEGEPYGIPGSYLNGFFESRPLPYAESAYGLPESGQTMVNITNGKLVRLLVDDENECANAASRREPMIQTHGICLSGKGKFQDLTGQSFIRPFGPAAKRWH